MSRSETGVEVLECLDCGRLTTGQVLRCGRCRGARLRSVRRPGSGQVAGATFTETASFAVVDLEGGLQLLAIGPPGFRPRIGDRVTVGEHGDGTYDMRLPGAR